MLVHVAKVDRPMGHASVVDSNNGPCPPEYGEPVTYFKGVHDPKHPSQDEWL